MKYIGLISLLIGIGVVGCAPDAATPAASVTPRPTNSSGTAPNEVVSSLYQQFHGKYKLLTSVSNQPLDINLDGKGSTNLLDEMDELTLDQGQKYHLDLRIYGPSQYSALSSFLFLQWWPEQFIRLAPGKTWDGGEWLSFNPTYRVGYDFQGAVRPMQFSSDLTQITVMPSEPENPYRWVRPEQVTVEPNGQIRVVNKRRLYTSAGVQEVVITSVYQRFTMST